MHDWRHEASVDWCVARCKYLSATNFVKLKSSVSKASQAALAGEKLLPAFAGLWEEKMSCPDIETMSYAEAARGHVMEPYAVESYNAAEPDVLMYHWDDALLFRDDIAFSPDAMDIPQTGKLSNIIEHNVDTVNPEHIMEIKSYGTCGHGQAIATNKTAYTERFQIAWAMYVAPSIKDATLLFYNPSAYHQLYPVFYTREDLEKEIQLAEQVHDLWKKTDVLMRSISNTVKSTRTEDEIWIEEMAPYFQRS